MDWFGVIGKIFLRCGLAAMIASAILIGMPTGSSDASPKKVAYGSRAAVNVLLNGNFPFRWLVKAGGTVAPKTLFWPLPGRHIGRGFGSRNGTHLAIDITAPVGTPVRAVARGVVGYADNKVKGYGKLMLVLHPGGSVSLYAHLDDFDVRPGDRVERGQVIARTGNTGISRGPHLHLALFENGRPVDPAPRFQHIPKRRNAVDIARRE